MYSIGVDLHKDSLVIAVLNDQGELVERKTFSTRCREQIRTYFSSYGLQCKVAYESVGFYQWFWELAHPLVGELVLGDPAGIKAYAGRRAKTDRNDSLLIARLLHEGKLPAAYVPAEPVRQLRQMVRLRHSIARDVARTRKAVRWVSLQKNLPGPATLTSDRLRKWMLANENKFTPLERENLLLRFNLLVQQEHALSSVELSIDRFIRAAPDLLHLDELLQSIAGIGYIAAATIIAETGDLLRFDNPDQLCAYAGLCPRVSQSGETVHHGHVSKQGPPLLRWVLQQAAWVAIRCSAEIRRIHNRIARKAGAKKAATAIARRLLVYAWSVARHGKPFQWPEPKKTEKNDAAMTENTSPETAFVYQI